MAKIPYILIIDDDPEDAEMVAEQFRRKHDHALVRCFSDSERAFKFLEAQQIDDLPLVLITDYQMPTLSGVELLKLLRRDHKYDYLAKVVLSTSQNVTHSEECLRNGADKYLVKPDDMEKLNDVVERLSELYLQRIMTVAGFIA